MLLEIETIISDEKNILGIIGIEKLIESDISGGLA
ncbi:hypothetical protein LCGC14_0803540 [marine sediment metagenome]|jgi:hypothetical protein|uniref:Uncharacterized protein n=1 Tax=marine sediment metagenome TaxID=412755 RepID=A0A0F9S8X2_9ZZZZ